MMSSTTDRKRGQFIRQPYVFRDRVTADGSSGYPAEAGRYHLYTSYACPWSQRTMIVREVMGLQDVITMTVADPIRDERGWAFRDGPGHSRDDVNGFDFLMEAYRATEPDYDLRATVPTLWDRKQGRIVSNNFPDITLMMETEFGELASGDANLYPGALRDEIDSLNEVLYEDVNDGVYRAGFAQTQEAYEDAFDRLFARLDELEERLADRRYLFGDRITESDVRLYVTLARFDVVYHYHFKCNLRRLVDYPNLWAYARDLYQTPGFDNTTDFDHIKRHYYRTHPHINPTRIVPKGPEVDWLAPHGREPLS